VIGSTDPSLLTAISDAPSLSTSESSSVDINKIWEDAFAAMNDDFNTSLTVASLFEAVKVVNNIKAGNDTITQTDLESLVKLFDDITFKVLGLEADIEEKSESLADPLMEIILQSRKAAKENKDYAAADDIRNSLAELNIQIKDGKLQENLSSLKVSYDRFIPLEKKPLLLEWYVFMARTGNQFMGVNQRYESGGGLIISHWKRFKNKDKVITHNYWKLKEGIKYNEATKALSFCNDVCKVDSVLSEKEKKTIGNARNNVLQYIRINETKFRIALLAGVFYEAESISFADSLSTNTGVQFQTKDFDATNRFRFNLRPTFDFHISNVTLKIRPHFKLPLTGDWLIERDGRSVYDMRFELPVSLGLEISKSFSLSIEYRLFHDQAPNSYLTSYIATDGRPIYLTANRNNHVTTFSVKYKF